MCNKTLAQICAWIFQKLSRDLVLLSYQIINVQLSTTSTYVRIAHKISQKSLNFVCLLIKTRTVYRLMYFASNQHTSNG